MMLKKIVTKAVDYLTIQHGSFERRAARLRSKYGIGIGQGCEIFPEVTWGSEPYLIRIGNNVRVTNGVKFVTHDGGLWTLRRMGMIEEDACVYGQIIVKDNVHIGWNAIIMPGVVIGENSIIGCGSIVTKDIPANSVAVGAPARSIKTIADYCAKVTPEADFVLNMSPDSRRIYLLDKYRVGES